MTALLRGKIAIVTGAGRGIGRAMALGYARAGAKVLLAARTPAEIEIVAAEIQAAGGEALTVVTDVSREDDVQRMVDRAVSSWEHVDILVNNAGVGGPTGLIHELDLAEVDQTWAINLRGAFLCSRAVIPLMIEQGGGNIINVSSGAGQRKPRKGVRSLPYQISKFAMEGLTNGLAVQLREFKINVNSLLPGPIATRLHQDTAPERIAALGGLGQPEDVVPAAIYLASRPPGKFTGQIVNVREFNETQSGTVSA